MRSSEMTFENASDTYGNHRRQPVCKTIGSSSTTRYWLRLNPPGMASTRSGVLTRQMPGATSSILVPVCEFVSMSCLLEGHRRCSQNCRKFHRRGARQVHGSAAIEQSRIVTKLRFAKAYGSAFPAAHFVSMSHSLTIVPSPETNCPMDFTSPL